MTQERKYHHGDRAERVVTIRLTPETHRAVRMMAARQDMTVSAFFRTYAEQATGRSGKPTYREAP